MRRYIHIGILKKRIAYKDKLIYVLKTSKTLVDIRYEEWVSMKKLIGFVIKVIIFEAQRYVVINVHITDIQKYNSFNFNS